MLASVSVTELRAKTFASVTLQSNLLLHLILTRGPGRAVDLSGHFDFRGLQWPSDAGNIILFTKQNFLRYDASPRAHLLFLFLRDASTVCTEGGNRHDPNYFKSKPLFSQKGHKLRKSRVSLLNGHMSLS